MNSKQLLLNICELIQDEMGMLEGTVFLFNAKVSLPSVSGLFISVGLQPQKPIGVKREYVNGVEVQVVNASAIVSIDIMSRDTSALERKDEVIMALSSTRSQGLQESLGFYIARIPSSSPNLSEIEGAAIQYRFNVSVPVQYSVTKQKTVAYYDQFSSEITTEA